MASRLLALGDCFLGVWTAVSGWTDALTITASMVGATIVSNAAGHSSSVGVVQASTGALSVTSYGILHCLFLRVI